jgi:EAL domain-containing protein (putative c-di-GMP-specific phosphodiesterase class I)
MTLSRADTSPARISEAAPKSPARGARRRLEMEASELARLIDERLALRPPDGSSDAPSDCALLLIRLAGRDGRRLLLPAVSVKSMLSAIRKRLNAALKDADRFSILGPNEIIVFLAQVGTESVTRLAMNRLLRALGMRYETREGIVQLHPAIGGAMPSALVRTVEQLASAADDACRVATEREDHHHLVVGVAAMPERNDLVPDLRTAIDGNRLEVHYQPQYSFAKGRCTTVEALVRWPRPPGDEPVPADVMVDLACRHGLIPALTRFVLDTALREIRDLERAGLQLGVAVNLAPTLFADEELPDSVAQALSVWGFPPERLTLEVTEASDLRDTEAALAAMERLRCLGTRLSIDDFGTGYSSLARLQAMPLSELKIDRLFVANMKRSRGDLQIVQSVIDLAHNFELEVVAEGVEDEPTALHLRGLGCDAIQGYFLARPMRARDLADWWRRQPRLSVPSDSSLL